MTETLVYQVVLDAASAVNNARSLKSSFEDIERAAKPGMFSGLGSGAMAAFNSIKSGAATAVASLMAMMGPIGTVTAGLTAMTAIGSSAQWEKQMSGVFKTTDLDRGTVAATQMNDELLDLYANMRGVGKEGITSVAQGLGSLGIANSEIKDTTKTVLEASAAFGMLPEQSMDALSTITNLWKGQTQEMGGVANMMQHIGSATNELGNKSKATEPNVLAFLAAVGGYATMYGETAEDTAALGALFESVGVRASDAETAMRSALQAGLFQSHKPAEDIAQLLGMPLNKSGKAESVMGYDVAANIMGIDKAEMRKRMETDLYGTMVDVASALKSKGLSETQQTQVAELIFGGYASAHWLKLAGQGEELDRLTSISREGYQSGTSMSQEYQRQTDNLIDTLGEFKGALDVAAIKSFEAALEPAKNKIAEMAQWVRDATPAVKEFFEALWSGDWNKVNQELGGFKSKALDAFKVVAGAAGVGLVVKGLATIGPAALGVGKYFAIMAATAVYNLAMTAGGWAASAASAVAAQLAFVGAWAALLGPIAGIVAGIGLVAAGLAAIGYSLNPSKFTTFNKVAVDAFNGLKSVISDVWQLIQQGDFSGAAARLKQALQDAWNYAKGIDWGALGSDIVGMIGDGAYAVVKGAFDLGGWIYNTGKSWVDSGGPKRLGGDIVDALAGTIESLLGSDYDFWSAVKTAFKTAQDWISLGYEIIKGIGSGILGKIKEHLAPAQNQFLDFIKSVGDNFFTLGENIAIAIGNGIDEAGRKAAAFVTWIGQNVPGAAAMLSATGVGSSGTSAPTTYNGAPVYTREQLRDMGVPSLDILGSSKKDQYYESTYAGGVVYKALTDWGKDDSKKQDKIANVLGEMYAVTGQTQNGIQTVAINTFASSQSLDAIRIKQAESIDIYDSTTGLVFTKEGKIETPTSATANAGISGTGTSLVTGKAPAAVSETQKNTTPASAAGITLSVDKNFVVEWTNLTDTLKNSTAGLKATFDASIDAQKWSITAEKEGAKEEVGIEKKGAEDTTKTIKSMMDNVVKPGVNGIVDLMKEGTIHSAAYQKDSAVSSAAQASSYTHAAATALRVGGEVGGRLLTDGGNAVRIGLDASGRQIAVIGQVAQQQFGQAGGRWISDTNTAGMQTVTAANQAGAINISSTALAGNILNQKATGAGDALVSKAREAGSLLSQGARLLVQSPKGGIFDVTGYKLPAGINAPTTGTGAGTYTYAIKDAKIVADNARMDDAICQVDEWGMTPGLGQSLIDAGVLTPNTGYSYSGQTAVLGGVGSGLAISPNGSVSIGLKDAKIVADNAHMDDAICQVDEWGMTPGLGQQLIDAGVLTPNYGYQSGLAPVTIGDVANSVIRAAKTSSGMVINSGASFENSIQKSVDYEVGSITYTKDSLIATMDGLQTTIMASGMGWQESTRIASNDTLATGHTANTFMLDGARSSAAISTTTAAQNANTQRQASLQWASDGKSLSTQFTTVNGALKENSTSLISAADAIKAATSGMHQLSDGMLVAYSNIIGSRGGTVFGGVSRNGQGAWVGTGSTAINGRGYVPWGGAAASAAYSGGYSGQWGNSSFSAGWAAQGADVTEHQLLHIGEKGPELVLPPPIRKTILRLADMGFASMDGGNQTTIEPADVYLDGQKVGQIVFKVGTSRMHRKGLSVK